MTDLTSVTVTPVTMINGDYIAKTLCEMRREWTEAASTDPQHPQVTSTALAVLEDVIDQLPYCLQQIAHGEKTSEVRVWSAGGELLRVLQ